MGISRILAGIPICFDADGNEIFLEDTSTSKRIVVEKGSSEVKSGGIEGNIYVFYLGSSGGVKSVSVGKANRCVLKLSTKKN